MRMNKVYNRIESIVGNVITVRASGVQYNELAEINTRFGKSLAQVNKIDANTVDIDCSNVQSYEPQSDLTRKMRDCFWVW